MKNKEQGSALVLVIFTLSMLMILAAMLSTSLVVNYRMKQREMLKEQEIYIDQACMVYTQAYLENVVNTAVLDSVKDGFANIIRLNSDTDDEYLLKVNDESQRIYNTKLTAAQAKLSSDMTSQMAAVKAVNYSDIKQLESITPTITSCDMKSGSCSIAYSVKMDNNVYVFNAQFNWQPYTALNKACSSIINGGADIDYIKVSTIYG